jgi:hypothetical protein
VAKRVETTALLNSKSIQLWISGFMLNGMHPLPPTLTSTDLHFYRLSHHHTALKTGSSYLASAEGWKNRDLFS